jgi:hypothetical protein
LGKTFALSLILLLALSSLMMAESANAQTIPKPSVPQFTAKFADLSYDTPTTTSTNPYTGQTITNQGHHVENRTIQITIKNQPFTSYIQNGENISFYLNVRVKGHYEENWITIYHADNHYTSESSTDYTTLTYSLDPNAPPWLNNNLPLGGQLDFQVEALIGSIHRDFSQLMAPWVFDGKESGWSNTQTITIPASSNSTPNPTATPTDTSSDNGVASLLTSLALVVVAILAIVVISLLLYVRHLKRSVTKPDNSAV